MGRSVRSAGCHYHQEATRFFVTSLSLPLRDLFLRLLRLLFCFRLLLAFLRVSIHPARSFLFLFVRPSLSFRSNLFVRLVRFRSTRDSTRPLGISPAAAEIMTVARVVGWCVTTCRLPLREIASESDATHWKIRPGRSATRMEFLFRQKMDNREQMENDWAW